MSDYLLYISVIPSLFLVHYVCTLVIQIKNKERIVKTLIKIIILYLILYLLVNLHTKNMLPLLVLDPFVSLYFGISSYIYSILNIPILIYSISKKNPEKKNIILRIVLGLIFGTLLAFLPIYLFVFGF